MSFLNVTGVQTCALPIFIVIDVLHLDDELRLVLHWNVSVAVHGLRPQGVVSLLLAVQTFGGMDIPCVFIDGEDGGCALAGQDILHISIALI